MEKDPEHIDQYLRGKLSTTDLEQFERRIRQDKEFAMAVADASQAYALIRANARLQLKEQLQQWDADLDEEVKRVSPQSIFGRRWIPLLAAGFAILVLTWFFWVSYRSSSTTGSIYSNYFEPYPDPINLRTNSPVQNAWAKGVIAYGSQDYATASDYFQKAIAEDNVPAYYARFYAAISIMAQPNVDLSPAINYLQEVLKEDHDYQDAAQWYLGLALIRSGDIEGSRKSLSLVTGKHASDAQTILNSLNE